MTEKAIERKIAELVAAAGGRVYYVGGFVRDRLLGMENKDVDVEVHGVSAETLQEILRHVGTPMAFGSSFGIYSLKGEDIDIALPRKEQNTGRGHRDFEIYTDPFIGPEAAARRRDFTVNALMEDVLTGEILDFFGGRRDLENGVLRHVDEKSFAEDPLRVLRGAQFAARFGFRTAEETLELYRRIDLSALSRERVEEELKKALQKAPKPSVFFETLREADQLKDWFPELAQLIDLPQDPKFHPEGDVWVHTMEVLDRAAEYRDSVSNPYFFLMLAITHDLGKIVTTEETEGRIHAYGHETLGLPLAESFVKRISSESALWEYIENMLPLHMKPNVVAYAKSAVKTTNRMFDQARAPEDLVYFAMCDKPVYSGDDPFTGDSAFLFARLQLFRETMAKPYVMGRDLIEAGLSPGAYFSEALAYAHKLRLAGIEKDSALKQVLSYVKSRHL